MSAQNRSRVTVESLPFQLWFEGGDAIRRLYSSAIKAAIDGLVGPLVGLVVDHLCEDVGPYLKEGKLVEVRTKTRRTQRAQRSFTDYEEMVWVYGLVRLEMRGMDPSVPCVRVLEYRMGHGELEVVLDLRRDRDRDRLAAIGTHIPV